MEIKSIPGSTLNFEGHQYLYFSGTSYLGLATLPSFKKRVANSVLKYGVAYGSSRDSNVKLTIYSKAEAFLTKRLNQEAVVTVSSGLMAGQIAVSVLSADKEAVFYAMPDAHPAILTNQVQPIYKGKNLNTSLKRHFKHLVVLSNAVDEILGVPFDYRFLDGVSADKITLLLDESHTLGVFGLQGAGVAAHLNFKKNIEVVVTSSLGKGYGINGGVIGGTKTFIDKVKTHELFTTSAGMMPALLHGLYKSKAIYRTQHIKLKANLEYVHQAVKSLKGFRHDPTSPVIFYEGTNLYQYLLAHQIVITHFNYNNKPLNRIVINANHSFDQIDKLVQCLKAFASNERSFSRYK